MSNPPAFPSVCLGDPGHPASEPGMTLRDWFAGQALAGVMSICVSDTPRDGEAMPQSFARKAYEIADAMLAARSTQGEQP